MAGSTEEVILKIRADVNQAVSELKKVQSGLLDTEKRAGSFASAIGKLQSVAAFYVIYEGMKKVISAGSDLEEQTNKFKVVFKDSMDVATKGVEELTASYAMSQRAAMEYTSTIGNMLQGMGLASEEAATMSVNLAKLAADYSSFNNVSIEEALTAFRSGLAGEMEPMRRFGKDLSEAALKAEALRMGILKTTGALDAKTKALATYSILMNKSKNEMGDMIRTGDSWANTQKKLVAAAEDVAAGIGQKMLPGLTLLAQSLFKAQSAASLLNSAFNLLGDVGNEIFTGLARDVLDFNLLASKIQYAWEYMTTPDGTNLDKFKQQIKDAEWEIQAFENRIENMKNPDWVKKYATPSGGGGAVMPSDTGSSPGGIPKTVDYAKQQEEYLTYIEQFNMLAYEKENERYNEMLLYADQYNLSREQIEEQHQENMAQIEADGLAKRVQQVSGYVNMAIGQAQYMSQQIGQIQQLQSHNEQNRLKTKYAIFKALANIFIKDEEKKEKALENIDLMYEYFQRLQAKREFERNKQLQLANIWINAGGAIMGAWSGAFQTIPNPIAAAVIAGIFTAAILAMAGIQTGLVAAQNYSMMAEGGLIQGTQGGTPIIAGEGGRSEAIIPLENPEAQSKLGGLGTTYNIYFDGAILANENLPEDFIRAIDRGMYRLNQRKDSVFAEAMK